MGKSTITIEEVGPDKMQFHCEHEPQPTGPQENWPAHVHAANDMMGMWKAWTEHNGAAPCIEIQKDAMTGDVHVTTREEGKPPTRQVKPS